MTKVGGLLSSVIVMDGLSDRIHKPKGRATLQRDKQHQRKELHSN